MSAPKTQNRSAEGRQKPRRGRPPKIDSSRLLAVAREVFLERGIRATTLEVAERAGVSEGTLFHRFKSKEGLFREAMQLPEARIPQLLLDALDVVEGLELSDALTRLGRALLELGRIALPLMMMSWSNPTCGGLDGKDTNSKRFLSFVQRLAGFFEQEMEAGRLRRTNPELIARVFIGSVHHYCLSRILAPDSASTTIPEEIFIRGLVDLVLHGAEAAPRSQPCTADGPHAT